MRFEVKDNNKVTVDSDWLRAAYVPEDRCFGIEASTMGWLPGRFPDYIYVKNTDTGNTVEFNKFESVFWHEEFAGFKYKSMNPHFDVYLEIFND